MALRIALFGQAAYGKDVLVHLLEAGHQVAGVYAPPGRGSRPDPLADEAQVRGLPLFRHRHFRRQGKAIPEVLEEYRALDPELVVLAYVTVILPPEILEHPAHGGLCFHPSLLPRFRGGAAIPWQIILGERATGVTVFQPDEGVDTGPIVVQKRGVSIEDTDTAGSLYYRKLYPLAVEAMAEAVALVDSGRVAPTPQDESLATCQGLVDDEVALIDWAKPVDEIDRLVRGCDPQPGAHARHRDTTVRLFDAVRLPGSGAAEPPGTVIEVGEEGLVVAAEGGVLRAGRVRLGGGPKLPARDAGLVPGDRLR